jgi:phage FluMu protein Com
MQEVRCAGCGRKLAEAEYSAINIKCPRCGAMNLLRAVSPTPERHGASARKDAFHESATTEAL